MAAVLRKTIGAGKQMRKHNSAITSKAKAKALSNIEVIKPTTRQPSQKPIILVLKVAHRMYDYVDGQDCGNFTSFTTRGHVIAFPVQLSRRFQFTQFTSTLVDFCQHNWPGGRFSGNYKSVFKSSVFDFSDWDTGFKTWTGHLQDDDDVGVNLRRLPIWPLDPMEKVKDLSVEEILAYASWAEQDDEHAKGKVKAQSNSYNLSVVYDWLYEPPKESPELGTRLESDDEDPYGLEHLYAEDAAIPEALDKAVALHPARTSLPPPSPPPQLSLIPASASHKRGISHTTLRDEREQEEATESRSRAGRLRKPSSKAVNLAK